MRKLIISFLMCWLLMFSKGVAGQNIFSKKLDNTKNYSYSPGKTIVRFSLISPNPAPVLVAEKAVIRPGYNVSCLGFFCRNEVKMDRVMPVQFRFRLGDLQYVNKLEGKQ